MVEDTVDYRAVLDVMERPDGQQMLIGHLRFRRWTPSVFKRFLRNWSLLRRCISAPIFAHGGEDEEKWLRFIKRLGFTELSEVVLGNGEHRRMFISLPDA